MTNRAFPRPGPDPFWRISVVCRDRNPLLRVSLFGTFFKTTDKPPQFILLVLGQGFRGEDVERACRRINEESIQDRKVITEGFSTGRARGDDGVPAGKYVFQRLALVCVEDVDPAPEQRPFQKGMEPGREWHGRSLTLGEGSPGGDVGGDFGVVSPFVQKRGDGHRRRAEEKSRIT